MRGLSLRKRLERLEAAQQKHAQDFGREAFVVIGCCDGETHLEVTYSDDERCWFQERHGFGPQLSDFGEFASVVHFTPAEAAM